VLTHREVVDDEDHHGTGIFAHALADGAISVSAGEVGEHLTNLMSPPRRATWWPSACATWVFPTPTVKATDGEVEVLEGAVLFEAGAAYSTGQGSGVAAGDFVFAEHLQEFRVSEFPVAGLGEAGIEGVEHAGEYEGL
jgi:hypothetical protein